MDLNYLDSASPKYDFIVTCLGIHLGDIYSAGHKLAQVTWCQGPWGGLIIGFILRCSHTHVSNG